MKKNKIVSYMNIYIQWLNFILCPILLLMIVFAYVYAASMDFKKGIFTTMIILLFCQFILIPLIRIMLNMLGIKTILFSENRIIYQNKIFTTDQDCRILYSKITLNNILLACAGELVLIKNRSQIILGIYNKREIQKIKKYISNISYEKDMIKP